MKGLLRVAGIFLAMPAAAMAPRRTCLPHVPYQAVGSFPTAAILVDLPGRRVACGAEEVERRLFTAGDSVATFYRLATFNRIHLSGRVVGHVTVDNVDLCRGRDAPALEALAGEANRRLPPGALNGFERRVYVLPDPGCGLSSLGQVGHDINDGQVFVVGRCQVNALYAHELGHTFGLSHASRGANEYGDTSDVKGSVSALPFGLPAHFNGPHMVQGGWSHHRCVTEGGWHELADLETPSAPHVQVLEIPIREDSSTGYYLSYRTPYRFDYFALKPEFRWRVHVHRWRRPPNASPGDRRRYASELVTTLGPGETFRNRRQDIRVTFHTMHFNPRRAGILVHVGP